MIAYIFFLLNTILTGFFNYALIKDVNGLNQEWHYYQFAQLIAFYLFPFFLVKDKWEYLLRLIGWGMIYPFIFNSGLNLLRGLPIEHLGKYDFLSFTMTIVFAIIGLIYLIIIEILLKIGAIFNEELSGD